MILLWIAIGTASIDSQCEGAVCVVHDSGSEVFVDFTAVSTARVGVFVECTNVGCGGTFIITIQSSQAEYSGMDLGDRIARD